MFSRGNRTALEEPSRHAHKPRVGSTEDTRKASVSVLLIADFCVRREDFLHALGLPRGRLRAEARTHKSAPRSA
jgi:hypothetical protein